MSSQHEARTIGRKIDEAAEVADDMKHRIKNRAEELVSSGKEALHNAEERLEQRVREKPFASLLAAGAVGLLIGLLIARKR